MGILDTIKAFRGNESQKPKYSFDAMYQKLEDTNQKAELQALINQISLASDSENPILFQTLRNKMNELFADRGQEAIAEFTREFSEFTVKLNKSFVQEVKAPVVVEAPSIDTVTLQDEANTHSVVTPRRFPPPQPIAEGAIITPNIISAQQRGLGVTANPEESHVQGEAYLDSLIEEAKLNKPTAAVSDARFVPHPGDKPQFEAKNDSVPGSANIDWLPPDHTKTIHPKPPEHLVK